MVIGVGELTQMCEQHGELKIDYSQITEGNGPRALQASKLTSQISFHHTRTPETDGRGCIVVFARVGGRVLQHCRQAGKGPDDEFHQGSPHDTRLSFPLCVFAPLALLPPPTRPLCRWRGADPTPPLTSAVVW